MQAGGTTLEPSTSPIYPKKLAVSVAVRMCPEPTHGPLSLLSLIYSLTGPYTAVCTRVTKEGSRRGYRDSVLLGQLGLFQVNFPVHDVPLILLTLETGPRIRHSSSEQESIDVQGTGVHNT